MAQNATIYKVDLSVSDMDRHHYETHKLTVAKHPSETNERLMVRLLAFGLNSHENLEMAKGLSTEDEPDIWRKSLSGELDFWVTLGQPSEKIIRQSCSKSKQVVIYSYGGRTAETWWNKIKGSTNRFKNLQVVNITAEDTKKLADQADRSLKMQVSVQDGEVMVNIGESFFTLNPVTWKNMD